jgi:methionine salvage enolase-phosphatase E1
MGLEKLDFKIVKRYLGKSFEHILKANDLNHHINQKRPDLMILKAPKRDMNTWVYLNGKIHGEKLFFFISRLGALKIIKSGWI